MTFVDTNVFLRALTRDDPVRADATEAFIRKLADGSARATTSEIVIAEIVYILSSSRWFQMPAPQVAALLEPLFSLTGLQIQGKERIKHALDLYAAYPFLDFEDALIIVHLEQSGSDELMSYDRHFDRVPGVQRIEPSPL
ncbi:hypothetical protein BH23CHL1_BH23CHL1_11440 [soil metagenome]